MKKLSILIFLLILTPTVLAYETEVNVFYGQGCPHCAKALTFLEELDNEEITVNTYELYFNQTNRELFQQSLNAYNKTSNSVPTIFIGEEMFVGFSDRVAAEIDLKIQECVAEGCESPIKQSESVVMDYPEVQKLTIPAIIGASAVDAINPCAFAVLIILVSTILGSKQKKKALFAGLAFSFSIFISYFLMGLGLYSAIAATGVSHIFFYVVAILAIVIGLFNLKDYLWYGKWFVMEVPLSWRPNMKKLIKGVTSVPGAFIIGFVVSLFLLPCTSGPYIVILGLLAHTTTRNTAVMYLLLYNIIFILPMIIITLAIYFGFTSTEKAEKWRTGKLTTLHLIAGIIMLLLGIVMLWALITGRI